MLYGRALSPQEIWSYYSAADPCAAPGTSLTTPPATTATCARWATGASRGRASPARRSPAPRSTPVTKRPPVSRGPAATPIPWRRSSRRRVVQRRQRGHGYRRVPRRHTAWDARSGGGARFRGARPLVDRPAAGRARSSGWMRTIRRGTLARGHRPQLISFNSVRWAPSAPWAARPARHPAADPATEPRLVRIGGRVRERALGRINNASLGHAELTGLPLATWQTLAFQLTPAQVTSLSGSYTDLTFRIALNVPPNATGRHLFDNFRFSSDIFLELQGIAKDSANVTKAIFTYTTTAQSASIPYGRPTRSPTRATSSARRWSSRRRRSSPRRILRSSRRWRGTQLTWKVGSHSVTATQASTPLPTEPGPNGSKDAILPDGTRVALEVPPARSPTRRPVEHLLHARRPGA